MQAPVAITTSMNAIGSVWSAFSAMAEAGVRQRSSAKVAMIRKHPHRNETRERKKSRANLLVNADVLRDKQVDLLYTGTLNEPNRILIHPFIAF